MSSGSIIRPAVSIMWSQTANNDSRPRADEPSFELKAAYCRSGQIGRASDIAGPSLGRACHSSCRTGGKTLNKLYSLPRPNIERWTPAMNPCRAVKNEDMHICDVFV